MKFRYRLTYKDFKRYFLNRMKGQEKHAFEKRMMRNAFDAEAYDGLTRLDRQQLDADISALKKGITRRTNNSRLLVPYWFRYAATILLLIGIGVGFYILKEPFKREKVVSQSVTDSSDQEDHETSAGPVFENERYSEKQSVRQGTKVEKDHFAAKAQTESPQIESGPEERDLKKTRKGTSKVAPQVAIPEKRRTLAQPVENPSASQRLKIPSGIEKDRPLETLAAKPVKIQKISHQAIAVHPDERVVGLDILSAGDMKGRKQDSSVMVTLNGRQQSTDEMVQISETGIRAQSSIQRQPVLTEAGARPPQDMNMKQYKAELLKRINDSALSAFPGEHHIKVAFKVNGQGMLSGFQFDHYPDSTFAREIQSAMETIGPWIPATQKGDTISSRQQMELKLVVGK